MKKDIRISQVAMIADFEDGQESDLFNIDLPERLPVLPMRDTVVFPTVVVPVMVEREFSTKAITFAQKHCDGLVVLSCQKQSEQDEPTPTSLYKTATVGKIMRSMDLPDHRTTVLVQGLCRVKQVNLQDEGGMFMTDIVRLPEHRSKRSVDFKMMVDALREAAVTFFRMQAEGKEEAVFAINNIHNATFLINYVCTHIPCVTTDHMALLMESDIMARGMKCMTVLNQLTQYAALREKMKESTRQELDDQQREYFLQQEIRTIQDELGESPTDQDIEELEVKAEQSRMSEAIFKIFDREVRKLERINPQSPDYNVQYNYLDTLVSLPWGKFSKDSIDLKRAERVLNADHYGLKKVKERILEQLAVIKKRGDFKAPILCLYGPPGIGKTSLGRSIAKAMRREYVRVSLGGIHDESEIRGHRKTYVGAMPGRILKALIKCGTSNPVFVLDEIDKVAENTHNGDPYSALLEVLDPEQNNAFHDNFIDVDFDLSNILFIATANTLATIPAPLRDRMEIIEMSGYLTEEKVQIAKKHLIPKQCTANGLSEKAERPKMSDAVIEKLIENYTRESGVRQLEKRFGAIARKLAYRTLSEQETPPYTITEAKLEELLGKPEFSRDEYQGNDFAGVVTGLAWTSVGGEILFIETSLSKGKGGKFTLTGNLGDVMKESATIALEYIKAHADELGIDVRIFDHWNIHLHVPEGATPKDGPSAGITMATSLASALTQRKVRKNIAMTGEITLRGKVTPVGGVKEKILAAKRAGITDIVLSEDNRKHIDEIEPQYVKGLTFHYVKTVSEVLDFALLDEKVAHPMDLTIPEETKKEEER